MNELRPIHVIATEIAKIWTGLPGKGIYFGAIPYLKVMQSLSTTADVFYDDSAESIIHYGLSNMMTFHGPDARRLKAELKAHLK